MKVRFKVSGDLMADSLQLPPRHVISDIVRDGQNFIVTVALYPTDGRDDITVDVMPTVTKQQVTWNWNIPDEPGKKFIRPDDVDDDYIRVSKALYERAFKHCEHIDRPDYDTRTACLVCLSKVFIQ